MLILAKPAYKDREYKKRKFPLYAAALSQLFGENLNTFYAELGLLGHNGIDVACPRGTPIYASHDGKVIYRSLSMTAGLGIKIATNDAYAYEDKVCHFYTIYWHLSQVFVEDNEAVKEGDLIGMSGNTGQYTTGAHLHFGLAPCYEQNNQYIKLYPNNGYGGYIDPLPFILTNMTEEMLNKLYLLTFKREPDAEASGYIGPPIDFVLNELLKSPEHLAYSKLYEAGKEIENL